MHPFRRARLRAMRCAAGHLAGWRLCCPMSRRARRGAAPGSAFRARTGKSAGQGQTQGRAGAGLQGRAADHPRRPAERIEAALLRAFTDRLGLEMRAGKLLLGSDRIAERRAWAGGLAGPCRRCQRRRQSRKLDQAWRVGRTRKAAACGRHLATGPGGAVCGIGPRQRRPPGADRSQRRPNGSPRCIARLLRFQGQADTTGTNSGSGGGPIAAPQRPAMRGRRIETEGRNLTNERYRQQTDTGPQAAGAEASVEAGEVKQTFSHGRTNKVVVEVKRRKLLGKPGAEASRRRARGQAAAAAAPRPAPACPPPKAPAAPTKPGRSAVAPAARGRRSAPAALEEANRRASRGRAPARDRGRARRAEENRKAEEEAPSVRCRPGPAPEAAPAEAAEPEAAPEAEAAAAAPNSRSPAQPSRDRGFTPRRARRAASRRCPAKRPEPAVKKPAHARATSKAG
jgi:hypothetical protein